MIQLKVGTKTYKKDRPTLKDWYDSLEFTEKLEKDGQQINLFKDATTTKATIASIKQYLNMDEDVDLTGCALEDLVRVHQGAQKEITQAFTKGMDVWRKNETTPSEK